MPQRILQTVTGLCRNSSLATLFVCLPVSAGDLLVHVEGKRGEGDLHLALVDASQPAWEPILRHLRSGETLLRLEDLPPGSYAVQVFQDSNGNDRLDLSPRGIPLEPVGFSRNPSLFNGKPTPQDSRFEHGAATTEINLRLKVPRSKRDGAKPGLPRATNR